jgi:hypothetical protein
MSKKPKKEFEVDIVGLPYTVKLMKEPPTFDKEQTFGSVVFVDRSIYVWDCDPSRAKATLLHEVLHALDFETPGDKGYLKEHEVRRVAGLLYQFFVSNPDVAAWIVGRKEKL